MADNIQTDVNPSTTSSPSASTPAVKGTDVTVDSSTTTTAAPKTGDSKTMEQVVKDRFAELHPKTGSQPDKAADGSEVQTLNPTDKEKETPKDETKVEGEKESTDDKTDVKVEEEPTGPVPLERFQEVVREKNEIKQQFEQVKPALEAHNTVVSYCQQHDINNDDFAAALELAGLIKSDPMEFKKRMVPIMEGLGVLTGDKLPEDLVKKVEEGTLSQEDAKELAQLRAQIKYGEGKAKLTEEQRQQAAQRQQEQAQKQFVVEVQRSWTDWEASKRKSMPDFKPKADASRPDGMWEMVNDKMTALGQAVDAEGKPRFPIRSPQDAIQLAEMAFKAVTESVNGFSPKRPATKHLSSNGSKTTSSNTDPLKAKTFEEAVQLRYEQLQKS